MSIQPSFADDLLAWRIVGGALCTPPVMMQILSPCRCTQSLMEPEGYSG
jgi:hypothetical protein